MFRPAFLGAALLCAACGGITDGEPTLTGDDITSNDVEPDQSVSSSKTDAAAAPVGDAPSTDPGASTPNAPGGRPGTVHGFAIFEGDMPPLDTGSPTGGGGGGLDPSTLHLMLGTSGADCQNPRETASCDQWKVRIPLPLELQGPGIVSLSSVRASTFFGGAPRSDRLDDCPMGGGSFSDGTLTIHSIDPRHVAFSLSGTSAFDFAADGTYEVSVCPSR